MIKVMIFILTFYFGLGTFFSFIVAPVLFDLLPRETAGQVVERIFPYYFGIGLGALVSSLLIGVTSKLKKFPLFLMAVNVPVIAFELFYIIPRAHSLKVAGSPEFAKMHLISMIASVISLFFTFGVVVYLIASRSPTRQ